MPYGESNVWWPIASALVDLPRPRRRACRRDAARDAAIARAEPHVPHARGRRENEQLVDVFAHLLGHPSAIDRLDPASARSTIHHTVAQVLEAKAQHGPIVLQHRRPALGRPGAARAARHRSCHVARAATVRAHHCDAPGQPTSPGRRARDRSTVDRRSRCNRCRAAETDELASELLGDDGPDERPRSASSTTAAAATRCSSSSWSPSPRPAAAASCRTRCAR